MTHSHGFGHTGPDGSDPQLAEVFLAFKRTMRLNRQLLGKMTSGQGGHPAQTGCLAMLAHNEGISQRELAQKLQLAPATVTAMLQRMEREGTIERWTDPEDQRITRIRLTAAGRELGRRHGEVYAAHMEKVVGPLSEHDRRELARILNLLADNVEKELER